MLLFTLNLDAAVTPPAPTVVIGDVTLSVLPNARHQVGDKVRFVAAFTDLTLAAVDPDVVTFRYQTPDGTETELVYGTDDEVVRDGEGSYHVDLLISEAGDWPARVESTGNLTAADDTWFRVWPSRFA